MGIKQYLIEENFSGNKIIELLNDIPLAFFALSLESHNSQLKIKPKAPKSSKPSSKSEETPKVDFCKIITTDKDLVKKLLFDIDLDNMKKVMIIHDFLIEDLEMPKNETDFAVIREKTKRIGKIIRKIKIDDKEEIKEAKLKA